MIKSDKPQLLPYIGRFTLLFLATYYLIGLPFLVFQSTLPESGRIALDFYETFRPIGLMTIAGQVLRAIAFALVFCPFYNILFENTSGRLILFGAIWGVALFGSVEPQPGSIEGIIYTTIPFAEHMYALIAIALQMLLFVWLFTKWEMISRKSAGQVPQISMLRENPLKGQDTFQNADDLPKNRQITTNTPKKIKGYTTRFMVVHVLTYWVIGPLFYQIAGYADALQEMEVFEMWRDLESIPVVLLVFFGQIFRGTILALLLAPFYGNYINKKAGWLLLLLLMFGLTALGSPLFLPEFILFEGTLTEFLKDLVIGIPEIVTQMLVFSLIFFWWQRKAERKK